MAYDFRTPQTAYDRHREDMARRSRERSKSARDIGEMPAVVDPDRRAEATASLRRFCDLYFPHRFTLAWSADHDRVIQRLEQVVTDGDLYALAMPRGSGKTTLFECAMLWAVFTGRCAYGMIIGASDEAAVRTLGNVKSELAGNELLLADWPEVVFPIHCLERESRRAAGQLYHEQPTHIGWTIDQIIMPMIPGSAASGAVIAVRGLTGNIRGALHTRPDGRSVRPSLVLIDDPQTRRSAGSPSMVRERLAILQGDVLGLAGPGKRVAGLLAVTVIQPGDVADQILDRERFPAWHGERTKMLYDWPVNRELWDQYAEIRRDAQRAGESTDRATAFYREHQAAMDLGARVAWPERHDDRQISGLQAAMDLWIDNPTAFDAEYQNEPVPDEMVSVEVNPADIVRRLSHVARRVVPLPAARLTACIDVQEEVLFYSVVAWQEDCTGYVIDYGTHPKQAKATYDLRTLDHTLSSQYAGMSLEARLFRGLDVLCGQLLDTRWHREDGAEMGIDLLLIDANWSVSTDIVYRVAKQHQHASRIMPMHGRAIGASQRPMSEYQRKPGDRAGLNWRVPAIAGRKRLVRHVTFDGNFWKSWLHQRLAQPVGESGAMTFFGRQSRQHALLADHLTAETRVTTEGRGRRVEEWRLRVGGRDNHWLDCLVGCAVAASMQGCSLGGAGIEVAGRPKRRRLSDGQRGRRAA